MTDLVERLRMMADPNQVGAHFNPLYAEAATALEAQAKELAALRGERDQMAEVLASPLADKVLEYAARAETAERERDEARAALKPFGDAADSLSEDHLDRMDLWESPAAMDITAGHLRAARAITGED